MKKTEPELTQLFEEQISIVFDVFKKLPNYGQTYPTFLVRPKKSHTFEKIRSVLLTLKTDIVVETFKSISPAHVISFTDESKIVILYANSQEEFDWLYDFYSYSNSIIIGKIFKQISLKYNESGLQYIQKNLRENHQSVIGTIDITKNFHKILEILELDFKEFKKGFKNLEEMFSFFIKSPYFAAKKFIESEKEQKTFILQKLEEYLILNKLENKEYKNLSFERVKSLVPEIDFDAKISSLLEYAERKKNIYDKFNGRVILDLIPGFDPKKIGPSMTEFKLSFSSKDEYVEFLINHSSEEIISKFKLLNQIA